MGIDPHALLAFLRRRIAAVSGGVETAEFISDLVPDVLDLLNMHGCAFALVRERALRLVTVSDGRFAPVEQVQERLGQGPRVTAYAGADAVYLDRVTDRTSVWPAFVSAARSVGIQSMAALPLRVGDELLGVLDIYSLEQRTRIDRGRAELVADSCAALLANFARHQEAHAQIGQLQRALESRVVIEQAKGIIAHTRQMDVESAFALLRRYATDHRAPLREVAHAVVQQGLDVGAAQSSNERKHDRGPSSLAPTTWSSRMLGDILDALPGGVVWWDSRMHLRFANAASLVRLGGTRAELVGRNLIEILGPDAASVYATVVTRAADGGSHEFDAPWWDPDQGATFRTSLVIPMDAGSGLEGALAFTFDNTARVNAQRAAQVDDAQTAVRRQRLETVAHLNLDVLPSLGMCRDLLSELQVPARPDPHTLRRAQDFLATARVALREAIDHLEHKLPEPVEISGIGHDPTVLVERPVADASAWSGRVGRTDPLPRAADLLGLLDALPAAVSFFDTSLVNIFANRSAVSNFGRTDRGEVIGRSSVELLDPAQYRASAPIGAAALDGVPQHFLRTVPTPEGTVRHLQMDYVGATADGVVGVVAMSVDVTEQVEAETAARRSRARAEQIAERERVAGELQDIVARRLEAVTTLLSRPPTEQTVPRVLACVDDAMSDLRLSVNGLLGLSAALGGIVAACGRAIRDTAASFDREPTLVREGPVDWVSVTLTNDVVETLREALHRLGETGPAADVAVELRATSDTLELTVRSLAGPPWRSTELAAMAARAERHGGRVQALPTDAGTVLIWTALRNGQAAAAPNR